MVSQHPPDRQPCLCCASENPYRTSLCLLVSVILSCLDSLLPFQDWHTANSLPLYLCPLFTNVLSFGDKCLFLNALSPFSFVPHGMKFVDGTKSLLEMYQLQKLIMILIKTTTVIYWILLLARIYTGYITDSFHLTLTTIQQSLCYDPLWQMGKIRFNDITVLAYLSLGNGGPGI